VGYVQSFQKIKDPSSGRLVQIASWFIGQQQPRIADQSSCQRHALLLSAREFSGTMVTAILQTDLLKPIRCCI
jgi:hypothetical protein